MIHILFRSSLGKDNCAKFYHCRICVTDFMEGGLFTRTFNPSHVINSNKLTRSLKNIRSNESKQCFQNKTIQLVTREPKTIQLVTREPKNLLKYLIKAKFEENPLTLVSKKLDFFPVLIVFITDVDISSRTNFFNIE